MLVRVLSSHQEGRMFDTRSEQTEVVRTGSDSSTANTLGNKSESHSQMTF